MYKNVFSLDAAQCQPTVNLAEEFIKDQMPSKYILDIFHAYGYDHKKKTIRKS
jgi:hypothetical protein